MNSPAVFFAFLLGFAQMPKFVFERDALIAGDKGYLIGPAHYIAGPGEVRQLVWSGDGRVLAALTESVAEANRMKALQGEHVSRTLTVTAYDVSTRRSSTIQLVDTKLALVGWLGSSRTLLMSSTKTLPSGPERNQPEVSWQVLRWTPGSSQPQVVYAAKEIQRVSISSKKPYALVQGYELPFGNPRTQQPLKSAIIGLSGASLPIADSYDLQGELYGEDKDGFLIEHNYRLNTVAPAAAGQGNRRNITETFRKVLPNGMIEATPTPPVKDVSNSMDVLPGRRAADPNGLQVVLTPTEAKHGGLATKVLSGWLWMPDKGKIKATLISAEVDRMLLSPTVAAIAFVSRENVFVREISIASAEDLEAALEAVERQDLMNRAKQVGTGMMIYGADSDDLLPPSQDWQNRLLPYLKNRNLTDGFYYEMNGEDMSKLEDPAKKRIGFIEGRYGRAIVFADSHVIWEKRKLP